MNESAKSMFGSLKTAQPGNAAPPSVFTAAPAFKTRFVVLKNRHQGNAAAAQKVGFKGNNTLAAGGIYAPYVPLQISDLTMNDTTCVTCGLPGLCPTCQKTMNIMDWIFSGPLDVIFPEVNTREGSDDGIVWKVPSGTPVWPVYATGGADQHGIFYVPKAAQSLDRDYFCHDRLLYKDTADSITEYKGGYGVPRGAELYAYQFHKVVNDGTGWVIGFILDGKYLLAHDVEMTDDELA
jgi:hypothetical protein